MLLTASSAVTIAIPLFWGKLVDIITDAAHSDQMVEKPSKHFLHLFFLFGAIHDNW